MFPGIHSEGKPNLNKSQRMESTTETISNYNAPKQVKGVRFKESFIAIPRPPSDAFTDYDNDTLPRNTHIGNERSNKISEPNSNLKKSVNVNTNNDSGSHSIVPSTQTPGIIISGKYGSNNEFSEQVKLRKNSNTPLQRRYSNESLISNNSVMMHTGTLIQANAIDDLALNQPQYTNKSNIHNVLVPSQPDRPAPVLKPAVGRKPSLDRSSIFQIRKQQSEKSNGNNNSQAKPTYEDTLKKCQSLTRHHSSPPSPNPSMNGTRSTNEKAIASRQLSCPTTSMSTPNSPGMKYTALENNSSYIGASPLLSKRLPSPPKSPAIAPKPDLSTLKLGYSNRPIKEDGNNKKYDAVKHLPPSGINSQQSQRTIESTQPKTVNSIALQGSSHTGYSHAPLVSDLTSSAIPPLNNRQHQLNQAFLNDLHLAMSAKLASQDAQKIVGEEGLSLSVGNQHNHQKIVNASVNNWLMNQTSLNNGRPINTTECESPPFPVNRFSNGEYDNIQNTNNLSMGQNMKPNHLIKPSGVAKVVKSLPNSNTSKPDLVGIQVGSSRPPLVNSHQRVKKMAPPPPPLAKRTKENEASHSNWKRS